jgi:hypothetical protein
MGRTWTVEVPGWQPPRKNQCRGRHWSAEARLKRDAAQVLGVEKLRAGVPDARGKRRVTLTMILGRGQRGFDGDSMWPILCDAMKAAHLIADDRKECVELMPVAYERGKGRGVRIELEDLP